MSKRIISLLIGISALAGGCTRTNPPSSVGAVPAQSFKQQWARDLELKNDTVTDIYLREDSIFAYTRQNVVFAISRAGGQVMYSNAVASPQVRLRPPVVLTDKVVIPTNTTLEVYNRRGRKLQSLDLGLPMRSGAAGAGQGLYIGVDYPGGGRLLAINLAEQQRQRRWELMTFGGIAATPALYQGVVYAASEDGRIYAVSEDRQPVWPIEGNTFLTTGPIRADVKADDFGVYVASTDSKLYCLDRGNGRVKWRYFAGQALTASPVATGTMVYQYAPEVGLVAIDKLNGKFNRDAKWISRDALQVLAEDEKYTYVRRQDNVIAALDKQSGQELFRSKRTDLTAFATNLKDRTLYAANSKGEVLAITPILKPGAVGELALESRPVEMLAAR